MATQKTAAQKTDAKLPEETRVKLPSGIIRLSDGAVKMQIEQYKVLDEPYYQECKKSGGDLKNEKKIFATCFATKFPLLIKGSTGSGKTRFVERMAYELEVPIIPVSCHEDLTVGGLVKALGS